MCLQVPGPACRPSRAPHCVAGGVVCKQDPGRRLGGSGDGSAACVNECPKAPTSDHSFIGAIHHSNEVEFGNLRLRVCRLPWSAFAPCSPRAQASPSQASGYTTTGASSFIDHVATILASNMQLSRKTPDILVAINRRAVVIDTNRGGSKTPTRLTLDRGQHAYTPQNVRLRTYCYRPDAASSCSTTSRIASCSVRLL